MLNNTLQLQVDQFCRDLCESVIQWMNDMKNNQDVLQRTIERLKQDGFDEDVCHESPAMFII